MPVSAVPTRSIASDCGSIAKELISPNTQAAKIVTKKKETDNAEKILKFKNTIWNKIINVSEFDNFNDIEYVRWMEIYKDAKNDLSDVNPVSIEQKLALIEVINGRLFPRSIPTNANISDDVQKLSALKLKKLKTHLKGFDLKSKLSREDLNSFASDLLIILKGPPISLLDYFTTNKSKRMNNRLMRIVQEDMLLLGLKGMVDRIPEKDSYTRIEKFKYKVNNFFKYKIWKYMVIPYDLPWIERVSIPDELLEKIMIDGLDAHDQELIAFLKKQNMIDHYERFRKVYRPVAFSLGFYFYYEKFQYKLSDTLEGNQEEEKKKLLVEFSNLADSIKETSDSIIKSEEDLKKEQFSRVIQLFKEKYNEDPTKEEYEEMRVKIFGI